MFDLSFNLYMMIFQKQSWNYWLNEYMLISFCTISDFTLIKLNICIYIFWSYCKNNLGGSSCTLYLKEILERNRSFFQHFFYFN